MVQKDCFFKKDNVAPIFEDHEFEGEFFAGYEDYFSDFGLRDNLHFDYRLYFDAGRYVIYLFERHSLYRNGEQYYVNQKFNGAAGEKNRRRKIVYVIITDEKCEYIVPSWHDMPLVSYFLRDKAAPLQLKTFRTLAEAEKNAADYSASGRRAAVLGICGDWDMY